MLDTIRVKFPITSNEFEQLVSLCEEHTKKQGEDIKRSVNTELAWGKFGYKLRFYAVTDPSYHYIILEFSVPKYVYGTNVFLFYPIDLGKVLNDIRDKMIEYFKIDILPIKQWIIQRIDLSYAFKFPTQEEVCEVLDIIKSYIYPRKKQVIYPEGVQYKGSSYDVSFYLKHIEFMDKEYKKLVRHHPQEAEYLKAYSQGILRFEVSLNKKKIKDMFKRDTNYADWVPLIFLQGQLNNVLRELLGKSTCKMMIEQEIWHRLETKFGNKKARQDFQFVMAFRSSKQARDILKKYDPSSINKKKKDLELADIGIFDRTGKFASKQYDLLIPNTLAVNVDNDVSAEAPHQTLSQESSNQVKITKLFPD